MKFYFAPMEGITGYIYRNAHHLFFPGITRYVAPFITAGQKAELSSKDRNDILPEHNRDIFLVPQILTNNAADFISTADKIKEFGYSEVNLNLGCPSGTVVAKGKGSGFLAKPEELDRFLDQIFEAVPMKISIKTRIGRFEPEEFYELLPIFNRYPISELMIHPRVGQDFYRNKPNWDVFRYGLEQSKNPVCYNGDIFTVEDYERFVMEFPDAETIMLGRGLLGNPGLHEIIQGQKAVENGRLRDFHDCVYEGYQGILSGEKNVLFKMKELWVYLIAMFPEQEKSAKQIKKAERLRDYEAVVNRMFLI